MFFWFWVFVLFGTWEVVVVFLLFLHEVGGLDHNLGHPVWLEELLAEDFGFFLFIFARFEIVRILVFLLWPDELLLWILGKVF